MLKGSNVQSSTHEVIRFGALAFRRSYDQTITCRSVHNSWPTSSGPLCSHVGTQKNVRKVFLTVVFTVRHFAKSVLAGGTWRYWVTGICYWKKNSWPLTYADSLCSEQFSVLYSNCLLLANALPRWWYWWWLKCSWYSFHLFFQSIFFFKKCVTCHPISVAVRGLLWLP